ncbi:MAG TPA: DUF481 domain-containing protein [Hanamia sp.]|nr:DUF481 domain-containing protein [Hanamia sp.]
MKYLLTLIFCFIAIISQAQIVNVESQRIQSDSTGWLGNFGMSFKLDKNKVQVLNLNTNAQIEYKTHRNLYLLLINYDFLQGASQTLQNNLFFHLRYNYKMSNLLRMEAFTQVQHNSLSGIQSRWLIGAGPRFKISGTKKLSLYAAAIVMYADEHELTNPVTLHKNIRNSSYASASWRPDDRAEITSTLFYQPLFKDFSDFRVLHELKIKFQFTKKFSFFTIWSILYDSKPATDVPNTIYSLKNGIEYEF